MSGSRQPTDAPTPRHRTPSTDVSTALLAAAEDVLNREGLTGLTVRAVATEAGVAPMGVYNRFGSKPGLIDALLARGFTLLRDAISGAAGEGADRLRQSGFAYRTFALTHAHLYGLMFNRPDDVQPTEETYTVAADSFGALVALVTEAMSRGELRRDEPLEVAQTIWSSVHGAVSLELQGIGFTPDPEATYGAMLVTMLRVLASER